MEIRVFGPLGTDFVFKMGILQRMGKLFMIFAIQARLDPATLRFRLRLRSGDARLLADDDTAHTLGLGATLPNQSYLVDCSQV